MAEALFDRKTLDRLARELPEPKRTLRKIGALLVAQGQKAFREQRFGAIKWKQRYANAPEPYLNKAGVLRALQAGKNPPARYTQSRVPALVDTGLLRRSLTSKSAVKEYKLAVEYGTNVKYASIHQSGGAMTMNATGDLRKRIRAWLKKKANRKFWPRFGKILSKRAPQSTIRTRIWPRPFIGITPELRAKVSVIVAEDLASGGAGAAVRT